MKTKELILPEFHSREEEAAFWDNLDTADYMPDADDDRWITLEWTERENRCRRCGGGMDTRPTDLQVAAGRVVLRGAPLYVCRTPGCGHTQLPAAVAGIITQIEALVDELLTPQETEEDAPSAAPVYPLWEATAAPTLATVREAQSDYKTNTD